MFYIKNSWLNDRINFRDAWNCDAQFLCKILFGISPWSYCITRHFEFWNVHNYFRGNWLWSSKKIPRGQSSVFIFIYFDRDFYFLKFNFCFVASESDHLNQFSLQLLMPNVHIFDLPYHVSYIVMRNVPWARLFSRHTSDSDSYCRTAPWDHCEISRCLSQFSRDCGRERAKNMDEGSLTWFRSFVRWSGFNFCFWWILELDVLIQS